MSKYKMGNVLREKERVNRKLIFDLCDDACVREVQDLPQV